MPKTIRIAVVQMFAQPAPTEERLARAEGLVAQAAQNGAQLVVLPEVFNTGYAYDDRNYACAEAVDGRTTTWMKDCAGQYGVHLMGTFLRAEAGDIYNTMLLVAPHGRHWHYDKNYPWMWERAYFRQGKGTTVADTELGKIGLLICWDIAHPNLWECYAGQVELIVVSSCPPDASDLTLVLPGGKRVTGTELGPIMRRIKHTAGETFGCYLRRQASHLAVPVVNTAGTGIFRSAIPCPKLSLMTLALACPQLWQYIAQAERVQIETRYFNETYLADARGNVLERVPAEKEGYALAEISIADAPPPARGGQPSFGLSKFAYLFDAFANAVLAQEYKRKLKERLGEPV